MAREHAGEGTDGQRWDESFDVIVVGFGGAGAAAALEAHARGARVVVIDRFYGGGATERSGGVVYLGGGSAQQKAAGYDDDPEQMFRYLQCEAQGVVDDDTLRAFCDESLDTLALLENLGVPFTPQGDAPKVSYPDGDVTLYFSGNELSPPYSQAARTAPRGHRAQGKGLTGPVLFKHIRKGVLARGIDVRTSCEARELSGEVLREVGDVVRAALVGGEAFAKDRGFIAVLLDELDHDAAELAEGRRVIERGGPAAVDHVLELDVLQQKERARSELACPAPCGRVGVCHEVRRLHERTVFRCVAHPAGLGRAARADPQSLEQSTRAAGASLRGSA
jgi:hypothetical protein